VFSRGSEIFEREAKLPHRFLCDTGLSGGAWLHILSAAAAAATAGGGKAGGSSSAAAAAAAPAGGGGDQPLGPLTSSSGAGPRGGFSVVPPDERVSTCDLEVVAPWRAIDCLTPDATQLADADWKPEASCAAAVLVGQTLEIAGMWLSASKSSLFFYNI
jgi:hypothetical protein